MRMSEILRQLSDLIASAEKVSSQSQPDDQTNGTAELTPVQVSNTDNTDPGGVFVPPLQAKLELLKKAVNVDNVYNQGDDDGDMTDQGNDNEDQFSRIRKLAGINPVVTDEAASDEPLDV
jgi:hypothetical protein